MRKSLWVIIISVVVLITTVLYRPVEAFQTQTPPEEEEPNVGGLIKCMNNQQMNALIDNDTGTCSAINEKTGVDAFIECLNTSQLKYLELGDNHSCDNYV